jgi:hypothetical protein
MRAKASVFGKSNRQRTEQIELGIEILPSFSAFFHMSVTIDDSHNSAVGMLFV